jgi:hypothetical protein
LNSKIIPVLFLTLLFLACSTRPSYVLSEKKMERVLYDLYLAEAEISVDYTTFSSDSARKQELLNSVLKKHKITEAVLDTSLAWYSEHLEKYFKINENLNKRFTEMGETLRKKEEIALKPVTATLLPTEKDRMLLRTGDLHCNAYTFRADTTLNWYGGFYDLQFNVLGISASQHPVVTLCVQCSDTAFVKRDTITANGSFTTSIEIKQSKQAKRLYGSIYFPEVNSSTTVFIYDFTLTHSFDRK